ncbi:MAG: alpha/beta fold hydrolase [Polyangiaceae bacterium]
MDSTILCIHSTGTTSSLWAPVLEAARLKERGLLAGNLGYPPAPLVERGTPVSALDDARHVVSQLPDGTSRVHLLAHSYGGLVALHVMDLLGPRVASAFIYEPVVFRFMVNAKGADPAAVEQGSAFTADGSWFLEDTQRGGSDEWLEQFIDYWNRPGSWQRMPEPLRTATRAVGWKMFQEVRACFYDERQLRGLTHDAPTTIAVGSSTTVASQAMSRTLAAAASNATLVELPQLSHMAPLTQPGALAPALVEHLRRVTA